MKKSKLSKREKEGKKMTENEINEKLKSIFIERDVTEPKKLDAIRKRISEWSNSIPYHGLTDLGHKIELLSVVEIPSYRITLDTLYEKRELKEGFRLYRGEEILPKSINDENVDIWGFNTLVENFEEKEEKVIIYGSEEVIECEKCEGEGEIDCDSCQGKGIRWCRVCHGKGEVKCDKCGGRGRVFCSKCDGKGEIKIHVPRYDYRRTYYRRTLRTKFGLCPSCDGRGFKYCPYCRDGYVYCYNCHGSGEVKCKNCDGEGVLTCDVCDGEGKLVRYLYFNDIFEPAKETKMIHHPELPKKILIYHQMGKNDEEENIILEITQPTIPKNILKSSDHLAVKSAVSQLVSSSIKKEEERGMDWRIRKQKLTIAQINVLRVDYKYLNKSYSLWLYGKENELLFAHCSPIHEVRDNYYRASKDLFNKKEYSQALDFIEKVVKMNPNDIDAQKFKETIINKIRREYIIGGVGGGIISGVITGSLLNFVMGVFCGIIIGLTVGLFFSFSPTFFTKIRESKKRYLYSFGISAVVDLLFGLFLLLL